MTILDTIKTRYSVRKYEKRSVEQGKVNAILEAAHCAPTAANMQPQKILVVQNPENLEKFSAGANTYNAPLVMLVCADLDTAWVRPFDGKNMVDIDASIVTDHKPDQDILYRFRNSLNDGVHLPLLLREQCCQLWNQGSSQQHDSGTSHQLFYVFYEKIFARNEP